MEVKKETDLFDNGDFILLVDCMAQRYHCRPTDFLFMSVKEFNFNVAVFTFAVMDERDKRLGVKNKVTDFGKFGLAHNVKNKGDA